MPEDDGMEKYGVVTDPKKGTEKTAGKQDPRKNVPHDPDKGTKPFEKKPEDKRG